MSKTINNLNKSLAQNITPNEIGAATSSDLNTVKNNIGTVSNLKTEDKTIVGAINELSNHHKLTQDNGSPKLINSGTFDDIKTTGIYTVTGNVGGAKPNPGYNGYYYLEVIGADTHLGDNNKWTTQRATIFEGVGYGIQVYTRICQDGTWTHWARNTMDGQVIKMTEDNGTCRGIPGNDANQINITGMWMGANVINGPSGVSGEWVYIESFVHNSLYQFQRATDLHNSLVQWVRHKTGGNWSEWRSL